MREPGHMDASTPEPEARGAQAGGGHVLGFPKSYSRNRASENYGAVAGQESRRRHREQSDHVSMLPANSYLCAQN